MSTGKRIAQARRQKGVREQREVQQSEVAAALGVGAATVSRWEADQAIPRRAAIIRLAAFLGVTPEYLDYGVQAEPEWPAVTDVISHPRPASLDAVRRRPRGKASGE